MAGLRWTLGLFGVLALGRVAFGAGNDVVYVAPGDPLEVAILPAALPEVQFGAFAARLAEPAAVPVTATATATAFVERGVAALPVAAPALGDLGRVRVAAVRLRRTFVAGEEIDRLRVLKLSVRYQDGMVARINDVEIARRNLPAGAGPTALSQRTRGSEWEAISLPAPPGLLRRGENLLEVEVRPSAARLTPSVDLTLSASSGVKLVRGPMLQKMGPDRATLVFETDLPTLGEVRIGERVVRDGGEPATRHEIEVDGLGTDSEVRYRVAALAGDQTELGPEQSFHTAPAAGEVVRFVVYGDVRQGHETHAEILRAVAGEAPDFVVSTGDHVLRGSDDGDWQRFFAVTAELMARTPFYPVLGNHDLGEASGSGRRFEKLFSLDRPADCPPGASWYGFDYAGVHVVVLDSNHFEDERQLSWLQADLAAARARGVRAILAATHHGPFSRGPHGGEPTAAARYVPVLVHFGTAVIFSGHDHIYQRGVMAGLDYVVTGGGGSPLYPITCGVTGRPACRIDDGARAVASVHHYLVVEVYRDDLRICPRRPDGTPVEDCVRIELPKPELSAR